MHCNKMGDLSIGTYTLPLIVLINVTRVAVLKGFVDELKPHSEIVIMETKLSQTK